MGVCDRSSMKDIIRGRTFTPVNVQKRSITSTKIAHGRSFTSKRVHLRVAWTDVDGLLVKSVNEPKKTIESEFDKYTSRGWEFHIDRLS